MPKKRQPDPITSMVVSTAHMLNTGGDPTTRTLYEALEDSMNDYRRYQDAGSHLIEEFRYSVSRIVKELASRLPHLKEFLDELPDDAGDDTRDWLAVRVISGEVTTKFNG